MVNSLLIALALAGGSLGCVVRTYPAPYYQGQPHRVYATRPPQQAQPQYAQPAYGGASYGQPVQPQYAQPAYGGASYGQPVQPQYAQPAYGGASYGQPVQPQYASAPVGTTFYGPGAAPAPAGPPPRPMVAPTYGPPVAGRPQQFAGQPGALWVPADRPEPVWLPWALVPGQWYVVEAWGAFSCWPDHNDGVDPFYGYGPWYFGAQPQPWAQLLIDDRPMFEIAKNNRHYVNYRQDHFYTTMIMGNGNRPKLQILDAKNGSWSDNRGGLWVRIYAAQPRR
jgi:hypothetical protein